MIESLHSNQTMQNTAEAMRYIDNAKDILRHKAQKEDGYYQDKKYVKMAGHTAYLGVLLALDEAESIINWVEARLASAPSA